MLLKKNENIPIKYNIDVSFTQSRYFVIPNVKGLCNRLQLFAGLYILSSYFRIPIILSSSMEWSKYWNLRESFPGQLIELPDRGMFYYSEFLFLLFRNQPMFDERHSLLLSSNTAYASVI